MNGGGMQELSELPESSGPGGSSGRKWKWGCLLVVLAVVVYCVVRWLL